MPRTRSQSVLETPRPSSQTSEAEALTWDGVHCNPAAKVILISSDHVSFRVDGWYLKQNSDFIKDLLDIPSAEALESAPIQLHQQAFHVRIFIDLVLSSHTAPMSLYIDDCLPLIHICDQLLAPKLDAIIWAAMSTQLSTITKFKHVTPWDIFQLAAARRDDQMCGKAVAAFGVHGYTFDDICSQPAYFYEGLSTKYVATLLTGNFKWNHKHCGKPAYVQRGWEAVADRFFNYGAKPKDLYIEVEEAPLVTYGWRS